jgi:uncharacterized protein YacL
MSIFIILAIYYVGAIIAYLIAYYNIKKFKTNDNPFFAGLFSWIIVIAFICIIIYKLFKYNDK